MAKLVKYIVLGLVFNDAGNILIAKRQDHDNLWEIPGGKVEPGEAAQQAVIRELKEELGINVLHAAALGSFSHTYADVCFSFSVFQVLQYSGQAYGAEGQIIQWVAPKQLPRFPFPTANKKLFKMISHLFASQQ